MGELGNIVIVDGSALHLYLHCDGPASIGAKRAFGNPFDSCASTAEGLTAFNTEHPLYGGQPVTVLVNDPRNRRFSSAIVSHSCTHELPDGSFYQLRDGLFVISPQLVFARMARGCKPGRIAEIATDLCARYYVSCATGDILQRSSFLVTPRQLLDYLGTVRGMRGSTMAAQALAWVAPNSGSPMETKTWLQFTMPRRHGGFGLPFDHMNYDVSAGRLARLTVQQDFSIDLACIDKRFGLEYDGRDYHQDAARDKRRRNELATLGWRVFPIEKDTLLDADATERAAHQIAHLIGHRLQDPTGWESRYTTLRSSLDLPC